MNLLIDSCCTLGLLVEIKITIKSSEDYIEFMKINCAATCGFCGNENEDGEEEGQTDDCEDNSEHAANCTGWKNVGYCEAGWY